MEPIETIKYRGYEIEIHHDPDAPNPSLESDKQLYQAWCYGNVYGFVVPELEESCWGFYGDGQEQSGLLYHAKNAIDEHIKQSNLQHFKQVKQWIKNRVPLQYRVS